MPDYGRELHVTPADLEGKLPHELVMEATDRMKSLGTLAYRDADEAEITDTLTRITTEDGRTYESERSG